MLAYERFGKGDRKVLALHGWLGDERLLNPMRHALDETTFDYVVPAYRGYGASAGIEGQYTLDELARDLGELIEHLGWSRFSIIGHSMGGLIGQRILVDYQDRIEKFIGLSPVPASGAPFDEEALALFRSAASDPMARRMIVDFSTGNRLSQTWVEYAAGLTERTRPEAMDGYLTVFTSSDISQQVQGIDVPVKVMVGGNEPGEPADMMEATYLRFFPNAELEVVANVGHCPIDEAPLYIAGAIDRFLKSE